MNINEMIINNIVCSQFGGKIYFSSFMICDNRYSVSYFCFWIKSRGIYL